MKTKKPRTVTTKRKKRQRLFRRLKQRTPHMKYMYGFFFKNAKIKKNTVLIESFHGKTIGDSGLVFAKEIAKSYPKKYKVYYATASMKEHKPLVEQLGLDAELVDITSVKYCEILATAEYIISNASLPIYYVRKPGQKYLQTWHGTPLKTLGKQMREGIESMYNVQHNFLQASHITFPNEFTRHAIMEDYNLERLYTGDVIMVGYPRNSVFLSEGNADEIRERLGTKDKKVYAYMPTWRGKSNHDISSTDYLNTVSAIFKKLDKKMRDDQIMYVNFHPIVKNSFVFDGYKHIQPFPAGIDSYEFLNSVDALVTDYSSVFFDFSLTKKPIVLFMYDYDDYMAERGMYMDVADLPFRQIRDVKEFCKCIAEDACLGDRYDDSEFFRKFFKYDSPSSAKDLLELLFNDNPGNLEIESYEKNRKKPINVYAPEKITDESIFRTLARVASGPDDVVLMYRDWFKNGIGQLLYDNYNDKINYLISANTPPRTYLEQIMYKAGSQKFEEKIKDRDAERLFPNLDIGNGFITNYGCIEFGYQADTSTAVVIDSKVKSRENGVINFCVDAAEIPEGLTLKQAVILDCYYAISYERDLGKEEVESLSFDYDFTGLIESLKVYQNESATPGLVAEDKDGNKTLLLFGDRKRCSEEKELAEKTGKEGILSYTAGYLTCSLPTDYARKNLRKIINNHDEYISNSISSYNMEPVDIEMSIIPHLSFLRREEGIIRVRVSRKERAVDFISEAALLKGYHFDSKGMTVKALAKNWKAANVSGAKLVLDSKTEDVTIPMEAHAKDVQDGCMVELSLKYYEGIPLTPIRWHVMIEIETGGEKHNLKIRVATPEQLSMLKMSTAQSLFDNGYVIFPYAGRGDIFKLYYRQASKYDGPDTRRKELEALSIVNTLGPYYRRKNIYLIYEKFCQTAQDNSYYFFKYCMDNLKGKERDRVFYVIDKESADYEKVKEYGKQVIDFMSVKHMVYAMTAKQCISTDSSNHLYAWQSKPSYVYDRIHSQGILFLQHGVTALKRVDKLFGKSGSSPMRFFVTTSETEQTIVTKEFGYMQKDAPIVGFARWDVLKDKKSDDDKFILIMPTWRQWLEDVDDESFMQSDYYLNYLQLLSDERLDKMLRENNVRLLLYLHPKFAGYLKVFEANISDRIECVAFGERPLNDIMMKCHMLITDYSSVCWDVLFMDKPVIFYHFDSDMYLKVHGSYINFETELPGPRETEYEGVLKQIEYYINNDFVIRPEHEEMIPRFFKYRDDHNCERTYKFLIDRVELGL